MNAKIYNGNVQPNPKEFKVWVNDEGLIKTWNGTEWIENTAGGDGSGSGGSEASGGEYIYLDFRSIDLSLNEHFQYLPVIITSQFVYYNGVIYGTNIKGVIPYGFVSFMEGDLVNIRALAIDKTCKIINTQDGNLIGLEEYIIMNIGELYNSIPRITKEEFYSLE